MQVSRRAGPFPLPAMQNPNLEQFIVLHVRAVHHRVGHVEEAAVAASADTAAATSGITRVSVSKASARSIAPPSAPLTYLAIWSGMSRSTLGRSGGAGMSSPATTPDGPERNRRLRGPAPAGGTMLRLSLLLLLVASVVAVAAGPPASAKTPKVKKPGDPTSVAAVPFFGGTTNSGAAPASDGGSPVTGYVVTLHKQSCSPPIATTSTLPDLQSGHTYMARVRAPNLVGSGRAALVKFVADQSPVWEAVPIWTHPRSMVRT